MGFFHSKFEFAFGDVLDILIDGKNNAVASFRLFFNAGKPALAGIHRDHQLSGLAFELLVELTLESAQPLVVGTDIAQDLGRQFTLRIKALGLFLKVDALEIERSDAINDFSISLARHPAKLVGAAVSEHDA